MVLISRVSKVDSQGQEIEKVIGQLESRGRRDIKLLSDGAIACVCTSRDSWAILTRVDNRGNDDKGGLYCFHDTAVAKLKAWVGQVGGTFPWLDTADCRMNSNLYGL